MIIEKACPNCNKKMDIMCNEEVKLSRCFCSEKCYDDFKLKE